MRSVGSLIALGLVVSSLAASSRVVAAASVDAAPACDRACLAGFVDRYLAALVAHEPSTLPLAPDVVFTENGTRLPVGESGLWKGALAVVARRELFADVANGQVAFWGVLDEQGGAAILSLRLKIQDQRIRDIETVVARKGSHALFSPDTFAAQASNAPPLPASQRVTRERLVAAADGYFEGLQRHDNRLVPSAAECNRFENGVLMTNRPGTAPIPRACAMAVDGLRQIRAVYNRRYDVVDEERGLVLSMVLFDIPRDASATPPREARTLLLAESFRVVGGEIVRIETVMHNLPYGSESGWAGR